MRSVLISLLLLSQVHAQYFEWAALQPFPGTARDDASAFSIGSKVFVGTGRDVSFALTNDWYAFDVGASSWSAIAALPASGRQYCSTFTDGTFGYLFGGVDATGPLSELWRYDPSGDSWQQMTSLPDDGRYATVAFENGMVCTGLLNGGIPTNECWQYSTAADTWSQRATVPGVARHRACGSGSLVSVFGGADAENNALADGFTYNATNDSWTPTAALPAPRIGADAVYDPVFEKSYVVGGATTTTEFHNDAWAGEVGGWNAIAPFSGGPRRGAVMAFVEAPLAPTLRYVFYGTGVDATQRYADWWVYTILTESVQERAEIDLRIYPNPTTGLITFNLPAAEADLRLRIYDMTGRDVSEDIDRIGDVLDLSRLKAGQFSIRIISPQRNYHGRISLISTP